MEFLKVDKSIITSILNFTKHLIEKYKRRATGTKGCMDAASEIYGIMCRYCDTVLKEDFTLHPGSLFNMGRIIALAYVVSATLLFWGGLAAYFSFILLIAVLAYVIIHYILYGTAFDKLFRKAKGCNVAGVINPEGETKQQIIIIGHHDSPYVFGFLSRFGRFAGIRVILALAFYLYAVIISAQAVISGVFLKQARRLEGADLILAAAGILFVFPLFFFISRKVSPGAGDNLNGTSIAIHIAKYFCERKKSGSALKNTKLVILSTDGEEAGQRGSINYISRHGEELLNTPAHVINIDSVFKLSELAVLMRDRHGTQSLSAAIPGEICDIAEKSGYKIKKIPAPVGSGTDAAPFAKAGIDATAIIAMPTSMFSGGHIYHTMKDTVDAIEPEAVEAVFNIAANYIFSKDENLSPLS